MRIGAYLLCAYPTAKISSSVLLCVIAVTSALQPGSRHLLSSSPFFTSQQRTSSLAPTIARPAPVGRAVPKTSSSLVHTAFDEADVTRPKVWECSNFLLLSVSQASILHYWAFLTHKYDLTIFGRCRQNFGASAASGQLFVSIRR